MPAQPCHAHAAGARGLILIYGLRPPPASLSRCAVCGAVCSVSAPSSLSRLVALCARFCPLLALSGCAAPYHVIAWVCRCAIPRPARGSGFAQALKLAADAVRSIAQPLLMHMPLYGLYARLRHSWFQLRRYMLRIACTADYTVNAPAVVPPIAQKYIRFKRSRQSARDGLRLPEPPMPHSGSHYGDKSISPFALYWTV